MSLGIWLFAIAILTSFQEEVVAQVLPPYGGAPIPYINNEDDDLGLLLTVLLLAGRNKGNCGCCNCCNCGNAQKIPIPYPIPFPTNNPIINRGAQNGEFDDVDDKPCAKPNRENTIYIDVVRANDEE